MTCCPSSTSAASQRAPDEPGGARDEHGGCSHVAGCLPRVDPRRSRTLDQPLVLRQTVLDELDAAPQSDPAVDESLLPARVTVGQVQVVQPPQCIVHAGDLHFGVLIDALAAEMDDGALGHVVDGDAVLLEKQAVRLVAECPVEPLVQLADPLPHAASDDERCRADGFDRLRSRVVEGGVVVPLRPGVRRPDTVEGQTLGEHCADARKAPDAMLRGAVGVDQARSGGPDRWMAIHVVDEIGDYVALDDRVGVEEQGITAGGCVETTIVRLRVSDVHFVAQDLHNRKLLADAIDGVVRGAVVDEQDLEGSPSGRIEHGL